MLAASVVSSRSAFFPAIQGDLPTVVRGEGIYLYDDTGRRFIDAAGGVGCVTAIGHGVAEVADAVAEQLRTLAFTPWSQFQTPRVGELAERVAEVSPGDLNHVVQFNSGSEVTEAAVKLARQYWLGRERSDKFLVISRWQGFHGLTLGAAGFSGHTGRRRNFAPMLHDMPKIPPAYAYRCEDCATVACAAPTNWSGRSAGMDPRTWPASSPSRWWARRWVGCPRRPGTSSASARSAIATTCCSSPTK